MESKLREIGIYVTEDGRLPFEEWLGSLTDRKTLAVIHARVFRLKAGNLGDSKPVGEGVRELRIDFGPGYRVYLAEDGPVLILLLRGGDKKTQARDIMKAKSYWADYRRRK